MATALMQTQGLYCERDDRVLIRDLDFSLENGEVLQIEGPNGSGKTTLLRILCGLSEDYEGDIFWSGQPRARVDEAFRQGTLYFGHLTGVKAALTPRENLRWILQLKGITASAALNPLIDQALQEVGLFSYEDVPVQALSAGQKRRVALARLQLEPARLWVLDEPFTAIDRAGVAQLEQLVQQHAEAGGAVLITTHHALELTGIRKLQLGLGKGTWRIL
ncbi:MAG: cytochrome c biogenesis heme-transporting ATPase CcmA [Pseudomonadota bacterium]|nr:heme ABC transporter ATP-binding protein CcmA [Pseudomonadales bacterium]MDY6920145.1 cytochrome c biogenesis heme-transporting ATPase CcmA [Pseudomonadota bacterium]